MKYWEIIIENLRNAGWNCGSMTTTDGKGRPILVVAAEREDAGRFIVEADQELRAFLELESATGNCDVMRVNTHGPLNSPACSCVSITLPALS
jgi:hypothetical protein